jgi:hypothetical protein
MEEVATANAEQIKRKEHQKVGACAWVLCCAVLCCAVLCCAVLNSNQDRYDVQPWLVGWCQC